MIQVLVYTRKQLSQFKIENKKPKFLRYYKSIYSDETKILFRSFRTRNRSDSYRGAYRDSYAY